MRKSLLCLLWAVSIQVFAQPQWTGTWAIAMQPIFDSYRIATNLSGHSVRQTLRTSIGGDQIRLKLSNIYSDEPLEIASIYIAVSSDSCDILPKTARFVTFGGKKSVTVAAGQEAMSDAICFPVEAQQDLSVTINYQYSPENHTFHGAPFSLAYILPGKSKPRSSFANAERVEHWYDIAAMEVMSEAGAIAIIGNSITDGAGCHTGMYERWTDVLARELQKQGVPMGVLNLGIGANCVLREAKGKPALERFDTQLLCQNGLRAVIIFEGVNDICGKGNTEEVTYRLIEAYKEMIAKARAKGLKVYGGTILPFGGHRYYTHFHEAARRTVNDWIRSCGLYDGVIDFDAALCDPNEPTRMQEQYQSDWLHPNPNGYEVMGRLAAEALFVSRQAACLHHQAWHRQPPLIQ